jgi:hypothetical protein
LTPRWDGPIIVAAPGPSLTEQVAEACRGYPVICIKQASLRMPWASVVYAADKWQWDLWAGFPKFKGERWSCHNDHIDNKAAAAQIYKLRLVRGDGKGAKEFSTNPKVVNYGNCSGFASLGFAIHWLKKPGDIIMVGFDFRGEGSGRYFNGYHLTNPQARGQFESYRPHFESAATKLPEGVRIINATAKSQLKCFPMMPLEQALGRKAA